MRQGLDSSLVLSAAAELADELGYDKVTLASIAKKLNIRTPSLYNHVEGLPGLKKELALYSIEQLKASLIEAAIGRSMEDALYEIGAAYIAFVRAHPGLYEATLGAPDLLDAEVQKAGNEIVLLLLRVLEPFRLSEEMALHAVRGLRSIVHGFASLEMKEGFNMKLDKDTSFKMILETYMNGLRTIRV
jgi:AcrR family transcriptional regulator